MRIVYVSVEIINREGLTLLELGGSFLSDMDRLLPTAEGKTWRDLFIKGFLAPPIKEDFPEIESGSGRGVELSAADLYKDGETPPEVRRRYGAGFKVRVTGRVVGWEGLEEVDARLELGGRERDYASISCPVCSRMIGPNRLKAAVELMRMTGGSATIVSRCGHRLGLGLTG